MYYGANRIRKFFELEPEKLKIISNILGRNYSKIEVVEHDFFISAGTTIRMFSGGLQYTEAFAGSGEFSVVMLVHKVIEALPNSLILLDEPEVSLHPGAQERMVDFFMSQCLHKCHQFIFATHSPALIRALPKEAIKVLHLNSNGQVSCMEEVCPEQAFKLIGSSTRKKRIFVEDVLAEHIIIASIKSDASLDQFEYIRIRGAETMFKAYAVPYALTDVSDALFVFDGDKKKLDEIPDPDSIPKADEDSVLHEAVFSLTGSRGLDFKTHGIDSAAYPDAARRFLKYCRKFVRFLPFNTPEQFLWESVRGFDYKTDVESEIPTDSPDSYKKRMARLAELELGETDVSSEDILFTQRRLLSKIENKHPALLEIKSHLEELLANNSAVY